MYLSPIAAAPELAVEAPPAPRPQRMPLALTAILALIALLALAIPALIIFTAPHVVPHRHRPPMIVAAQRIVPPAEIPQVEPVIFENITPDDARAYNATIPFSTAPNPAARPFKFAGTPDQLARASDCMAAAVLYEAGDDPEGQRAVAQVVINRVRHPAFPKTICGVVFQGSERATGCQFTFTCDGALQRHGWSADAWTRARATASAALGGSVFAPVGYSTHYHTDWVVPYWSASLDKVAEVHTHLFFRWTGWWGTPPAFHRDVSFDEPIVPQLALLSDAHKLGVTMADVVAGDATDGVVTGGAVAPAAGTTDSFLVTIDPRATPDTLTALAGQVCGDRAYCKVMAWSDRARTPGALPLEPEQVAAMSFSYLRDRAHGFEKALWNCAQFKRAEPGQCMKQQIAMPASLPIDGGAVAVAKAIPPVVAAAIKPEPDGLAGVRRKEDPAPSAAKPTAKPVPTPRPTPKLWGNIVQHSPKSGW